MYPLRMKLLSGWAGRRILLMAGLLGVLFCDTPLQSAEPKPSGSSDPQTAQSRIQVQYPLDETLFPPELPAPLFRWSDPASGADSWRIQLRFQDSEQPLEARAHAPEWRPGAELWATIKSRSVERTATATILGFQAAAPGRILSSGRVRFAVSRDPVGAPIFYREVNLPFEEAVKDPSLIRWRFGTIASPQPPPVVLERLPVCGNCHSFSSDGRVLGMDVDYANSKGSYVITQTRPQMTLDPRDVITWDDYRRDDGELTFGLLSQVSPDGKRVISTVKDKSVFVPKPDLAFSQLFFPIKGILVVFDRETGAFKPLPGADNPEYVQSNPAWSPDGRYVVFARTKAYDLSNAAGKGKVLLTPDECREFLKDGKPFRFDLYRVPYSDGKGGEAEPLEGASNNGLSNYFPRYSPDGKWIVFCQAANYMLLQPDSQLYIIPAGGGQARRLRANTPRMNSWHSWSPNGRWLVFSSKVDSPYTQLFLTHIDERGESTPAVSLAHMTAPDRAANIPEFVRLPADGIVKIQEQFLNDYSFERAGNEFYRAGETDEAIAKYREALALNPKNVNAHQRLGFLLYHVKHQFEEGLAHTEAALRLDPKNAFAQSDLGVALLNQGRPAQAIPHLQAALQSLPFSTETRYKPEAIRFHLAQASLQSSRFADASAHLEEVLRLDPERAEAHYLLALALACQGFIDKTVEQYAKAVALKPGIDTSVTLHELLAVNYAKAARFDEAIRSAEHALQLARASGKTDLAQKVSARLDRYRKQRSSGQQ